MQNTLKIPFEAMPSVTSKYFPIIHAFIFYVFWPQTAKTDLIERIRIPIGTTASNGHFMAQIFKVYFPLEPAET